MSYTPPTYVDTKAQAILALASVVADTDKTALGNGTVNGAIDVLADVLAESDVQVPQTNAGAILALAQYASGMLKPEGTITITENGEGIDVAQYATADVSVSGGGGGNTVEVRIYEVYGEQALTTAYFTAKNSAGESITPILHEDGNNSYFTIEVDAGNVVTLENVDGSGYSFNAGTTAYALDEEGDEPVFAPIRASSSSVTLIAVNDASYPYAYMLLMLSGTN